jgi:hypothetical protein
LKVEIASEASLSPTVAEFVLVRYNRQMRLYLLIVGILFLTLTACNGPPLYQGRAAEFLHEHGVEEELIQRLVNRREISPDEADRLAAFNNIPVLHLVASNPSTSKTLLYRLAKHSSFEVHTGIVSNPSAPLDLVLSFRTPGKYTTVNDAMARNPNLPSKLLCEMYDQREIGRVSPGLNPNCPPEIMWRIYQEGNSTDHAWLATNPNLPAALMARLESSSDKVVKDYLRTNPSYKKRLNNE